VAVYGVHFNLPLHVLAATRIHGSIRFIKHAGPVLFWGVEWRVPRGRMDMDANVPDFRLLQYGVSSVLVVYVDAVRCGCGGVA